MKKQWHTRSGDKDVKRVCGDKSGRRCQGAVNMIKWFASGVNKSLPVSAGCTSGLINTEDLMLFWTPCRKPPAVMCMCERKTQGNSVANSPDFTHRSCLKRASDFAFTRTPPPEKLRRISGVQCMSESSLRGVEIMALSPCLHLDRQSVRLLCAFKACWVSSVKVKVSSSTQCFVSICDSVEFLCLWVFELASMVFVCCVSLQREFLSLYEFCVWNGEITHDFVSQFLFTHLSWWLDYAPYPVWVCLCVAVGLCAVS